MTSSSSAAAAALLGLLLLSACSPASGSVEPATGVKSEGVDNSAEIDSLIRAVNVRYRGISGVAVSYEGGTISGGLSGDTSAWSTLKVPIAIAAQQKGTGQGELIDAAISRSDNGSATRLWASLGGEKTAAHAVEQVMWRAGGPGNVRHAVTHYPGGPFGNSTWTLESQSVFATELPCIDGAGPVYEAMGEIAPWQNDGMGQIPGARFKGGWSGENIRGGEFTYTYRQFGTLPSGDGVVGVAIIAHPKDGTHETAAKMLEGLARGVEKLVGAGHLGPSMNCVPE